jgi:hypothetical protein
VATGYKIELSHCIPGPEAVDLEVEEISAATDASSTSTTNSTRP